MGRQSEINLRTKTLISKTRERGKRKQGKEAGKKKVQVYSKYVVVVLVAV